MHRLAEARLYSAEDFRRRVVERLQPDRGAATGDHAFNPDIADRFLRIERRPAAVLVPVIQREPEATLLLTERTSGMRSHGGQIAFPGGRIDPEDAGPEAAALREAEEEIGLTADFVETLCLGPDYLTGSGYHVAPVIAVVRPGFDLRVNPAEVADVIRSAALVPDGTRPTTIAAAAYGRAATRYFFEMPYGDRYIWGITAGILRVLYERLYREPAEAAE
jgi:8-oxo-dGTP pyrophosphatase MutT (NUDIX family)